MLSIGSAGGPVGITPFMGGGSSSTAMGGGPGSALPVAYSYVPSALAASILNGNASASQSALDVMATEGQGGDSVEGLGEAVEGLGASLEGVGEGVGSLGAGIQGLGGSASSPACLAVLDDGGGESGEGE